MKKLLVLALVMGVASIASAGFSLVVDGSTVTIVGADNDAQPVTMHFLFSGIDAGEPTIIYDGAGAGVTPNMGAAGNFENFLGLQAGSVKGLFLAELKDTAEPFTPLNGDLVSADFGPGLGEIYLLNATGGILDKVVVPEPMTMGLLGLGALFLRRKK